MASPSSSSISPQRSPSHDSNAGYFPLDTLPPTYTPLSTPRLSVLNASLNASLNDEDCSTTTLLNEPSILHSGRGRLEAILNSSEEGFSEPHGIPRVAESTPLRSQPGSRSSFGPSMKPNCFNHKDWLWELAAAALSLACSISLVGVLIAYHNKSLTRWPLTFGITLNTLVAILSTLSRTALLVPIASCISQLKWVHFVSSPHKLRELQLFDDASRGPWGSLTLIWRLHCTTKLAAWGSVITILSLAMSPFTQQLLSYPSRLYFSPEATIHVGQIYDSGEQEWYMNELGVILGGRIDPEMERAIIRGLYNMNPDVRFQCPSGNCLWDTLTTLAVSSACKNVTSDPQTRIACDGTGSCNITTPSGLTVGSNKNGGDLGGTSLTNLNSVARYDYSNSVGKLRNSTIVEFAIVKGSWLPRPDITECEIRWCARVVRNTTVVNGTFSPGISEDISLTAIENPPDDQDWNRYNITEDHISFLGNRAFSIAEKDNEQIRSYLGASFSLSLNDLSSSVFSALSGPKSPADTVTSISNSMTYAVGRIQSATKVEGKATEQYIRVNWVWFILPLAEVIMGIAFLVCTLIHTKRKKVTAWKSSIIALLLTAMYGWDGTDLRATSSRDLEKRSEGMRGLLVPNSTGAQQFSRMDG